MQFSIIPRTLVVGGLADAKMQSAYLTRCVTTSDLLGPESNGNEGVPPYPVQSTLFWRAYSQHILSAADKARVEFGKSQGNVIFKPWPEFSTFALRITITNWTIPSTAFTIYSWWRSYIREVVSRVFVALKRNLNMDICAFTMKNKIVVKTNKQNKDKIHEITRYSNDHVSFPKSSHVTSDFIHSIQSRLTVSLAALIPLETKDLWGSSFFEVQSATQFCIHKT